MGIQIPSARHGSLPAVPKSMLALSYRKSKYIKTYVENPSHPSFPPLLCLPLAKQGSQEQGTGNVFPRQLTFYRHHKGTLDIKSMCEVKESCYSPYYGENYGAERLNPKFLNGLLLYSSFLCKNNLNTKGPTVAICFGQSGKYSYNLKKNPSESTSKTLD